MKYFKCIFNNGELKKEIDLTNITEEKAYELKDKIFCNGVNEKGEMCNAPLFSAHNPFDKGKTMYFKAKNENHIEGCPYKDIKIDGGTKGKGRVDDGYFTREQINNYVRNLEKRLFAEPKPKKEDGPKVIKEPKGNSGENAKGNDVRNGHIISGDAETGIKGRMKTVREVTESDVGAEVGIYGNIKSFIIDDNGDVTIKFKDKRLENIKVLIGQIYKNNNQQFFNSMYRVKQYIDELKKEKKEAFCIVAGLVNKYNNNLVIELQTDRSFRINKKNILDIIRGI